MGRGRVRAGTMRETEGLGPGKRYILRIFPSTMRQYNRYYLFHFQAPQSYITMAKTGDHALNEEITATTPETADRRDTENQPGSDRGVQSSDETDLPRRSEVIEEEPKKPSTLSSLPPSSSWADDAEDKEERIAEKARKKAEKAKRKEEKAAARHLQAEKDRADGKPPSQPCRYCKEPHWSEDCPNRERDEEPTPPSSQIPHSSPPQPSLPVFPRGNSKRGRAESSLGASPSKPARKKSKVDSLRTEGSSARGSSPSPMTIRKKQSSSSLRPQATAGARAQKSKSAPKPDTTGVKTVETRRGERARAGQAEIEPALAEGHWIHLRLPRCRRGPNQVSNKLLLEAVTAVGLLKFSRSKALGEKGWVAMLNSAAEVAQAAGQSFVLAEGEEPVAITQYHKEGPQVYVAKKGGENVASRGMIASQISQRFNGVDYWMAVDEWRGSAGPNVVIVFASSPNLHKFDVPLGQPGRGHQTPFRVYFGLANLDAAICEVCAGTGHNVLSCDSLQTYVPNVGETYAGLIKECPPIK